MAEILLPLVDADGNSFNLYAHAFISATDDGTYHVVEYKNNPMGNVQTVNVTDASFLAAVAQVPQIVSVVPTGGNAADVEYINTDRISKVSASGSNALLTYDDGFGKRDFTITSTLAAFLLLAGEGGFQANFTLTTAQILALNSTEIELIAAPGAGKYIVVDSCEATIDYNSATYAAGGNIVLSYTDVSGVAAATLTEAFVESTADAAIANCQNLGVVPAINAPLVAAALVSDPTTGDSDIVIKLKYHISSIL